MVSNICLPNWLNNSKINDLKKDLEYAEPYSQEELDDLPFDGEIDWKRYNAYSAKKSLRNMGFYKLIEIVK